MSHLDSLVQQMDDQIVCFGDRIKIWAKSAYIKNEIPGTYDPKDRDGGYIGIYEKLDRSSRVMIPPVGFQAQGTFHESVFTLEDPHAADQAKSVGQQIRYGDPIVMVDDHGFIWNNKSGGFFEAYLGPRPRGSPGELFISFQKNGREREPIMYGDVGVYIDVEDSHRYRGGYNQRLTNYKTSSSRVIGGYICSDGTGYDMFIQIHRHTGPPVPQLLTKARKRLVSRSTSSRFLAVSRIESIAVQSNDGSEDVMVVKPPNDQPVTLYGVADDSVVNIKITGGTVVAIKASVLKRDKSYDVKIKSQTASDVPMKFRATWEKVNEDDNDNTSDSGNRSLVKIVISAVKLCLVYFLITFLLPYGIHKTQPYFRAQIENIYPFFGDFIGADVIKIVLDLLDGFIVSISRNAIEIVHEPHVLFSTLGPLICFLFGLMTPSAVWSVPKAANRDESVITRWKITTQLAMHERERSGSSKSRSSSVGNAEQALPVEEEEEDPQPKCKWMEAGVDEKGTPKHPAFIRFLNGELGDRTKALKRWRTTTEWRAESNLDSILDLPHPYFDVIKRYVPQYYIGRGKHGNPIYVDMPGGVKMKPLKKAGVKLKDLLYHFVYISEFLWNELEPSEEGRTISILDLSGISMFAFAGEVVDFVKKASAISQEHYPERSHKIYVINAPGFFSGIWSMIKHWLAEETVKKISISKSPPKEALLEDIDADVLPKIYGGNNEMKLEDSPFEVRLRNNVYEALLFHGASLRGDDGKNTDEDIGAKIDPKYKNHRRAAWSKDEEIDEEKGEEKDTDDIVPSTDEVVETPNVSEKQ